MEAIEILHKNNQACGRINEDRILLAKVILSKSLLGYYSRGKS